MPSTTPITLLSLNDDVLREILAHLLLDTPWHHRRAAVLRACSLLHDLGLPHLYAVVDLIGFGTGVVELCWETLFGVGGLFAEKDGRGRWVRELRFGPGTGPHLAPRMAGLSVAKLYLPNCSSLQCHEIGASFAPALPHIISQIPVKRFEYGRKSPASWPSAVLFDFYSEPLDDWLGLSTQPWPTLETVIFGPVASSDDVEVHVNGHLHSGESGMRLSLSLWSFRTLVLRLPRPHNVEPKEEIDFVGVLFDPEPRRHELKYFRATEKIVIKTYPELEELFRKAVEERGGYVGLSAFQKRIAGMMVFVHEDGTERRLLEGA